MKTAVLLIVFNRPDTTRQVLIAIRAVRPSRLYVAADGPRATRESDREFCEAARHEAIQVDWPCELTTLLRDKNLGCKVGVSTAIDWFLQNEEEGIILEDDVLPDSTFFTYCEELLERYRNDHRIAMISGSNLVIDGVRLATSYGFTTYGHIWGWATWRRAWRDYDCTMARWPQWRDDGGLDRLFHGNRPAKKYWRTVFDATRAGKVDTWDYQWQFCNWYHGRVAIVPSQNLTRNVGFRSDATHTTSSEPDYLHLSLPNPMRFPLHHPSKIELSGQIISQTERRVFQISLSQYLRANLRSLPLVGCLLARAAAYWRRRR